METLLLPRLWANCKEQEPEGLLSTSKREGRQAGRQSSVSSPPPFGVQSVLSRCPGLTQHTPRTFTASHLTETAAARSTPPPSSGPRPWKPGVDKSQAGHTPTKNLLRGSTILAFQSHNWPATAHQQPSPLHLKQRTHILDLLSAQVANAYPVGWEWK